MSVAEAVLTGEEAKRFADQGFVVPRFRFAPDVVERLRIDIADYLEANPHLTAELPITHAHIPAPDASGRDHSLMWFCLRPDLLDVIEALEGPDLILWTTSVFHRPAVKGVATPWHQDGEYWPIEPITGASAWVAVTPARRENGCLRVIPCSHKRHARHVERDGSFSRTLAPNAFDEADAVDIELEPGEMFLFHPLLIHGSWPNTSGVVRTGFAVRYFATTSFFNHEGGGGRADGRAAYADRPLYLVRGVDRCGRNDLVRNHARETAPS